MQSQEIVRDSLEALTKVAEREMPRILSQFCRDENSPFFGSADRNWWHYKMRDFPSIILQQAGAALYAGQKLKSFENYKEELLKLTRASCVFWNERAIKFRSFEEYYPWEEGYPPLAFSTLSTARLVSEGAISIDYVKSGLKVAAKQLLSRFEMQAANQQVAGLAALCWIKRIEPSFVTLEEIDALIDRTLSLQNDEGWFEEYGGPDLGYLSVTIDCLWDAYDALADIRLINSAEKALIFLDHMVKNSNGKGIGMHNSRNTDYIVPYGITRFLDASINEKSQMRALRVMQNIFTDSDSNTHFFSAIDDRYWCHYIGLSVVRSINSLQSTNLTSLNLKAIEDVFDIYLPSSGYVWNTINDGQFKILISMKKGGVFTIFSNSSPCSDFGWILNYQGKEYVSHWWSNEWHIKKGDTLIISGFLFTHNEIKVNPFNHFLLRVVSFFIGRRLILFLKNKFIFKKRKNKIGFTREIVVRKNLLEVIDKFTNLPIGSIIIKAPRTSKRHVASANNFHIEDFNLGEHIVSEERNIVDDITKITTIYSLQ
jgi:hypothetical protein